MILSKQEVIKKYDKKELNNKSISQGLNIVVVGGGTGLSTMLRGLKLYTSNLTAIVTVADDGGGSGILRDDLGILPPGDIRNCILALANTEPIMEELLQYRFKDGRLKNQSFGNLFLAAMDGISDNFMEAVRNVSYVLAVKGKVLPVSLDNIVLKAKLNNGKVVTGESNIPKEVITDESDIKKVFIEPTNAKALEEALEEIRKADAIILGPGSLYTSVIPNLLVKEIREEISKSESVKIYVSNIMTQKGETDKYCVSDHIKAIFDHSKDNIFDYVIVNTGTIDNELSEKYSEEEASIVCIDEQEIKELNVEIIEGDFVKIENGHVRHDAHKLSEIIMKTIQNNNIICRE